MPPPLRHRASTYDREVLGSDEGMSKGDIFWSDDGGLVHDHRCGRCNRGSVAGRRCLLCQGGLERHSAGALPPQKRTAAVEVRGSGTSGARGNASAATPPGRWGRLDLAGFTRPALEALGRSTACTSVPIRTNRGRCGRGASGSPVQGGGGRLRTLIGSLRRLGPRHVGWRS